MKNSFPVDIPKPCGQSWEQMAQTANGKFCSHCSTEVIDFTQMTTAQLQLYFKNTTQPICGRIDTFQLHWLNHPPALHTPQIGFSFKIAMASVMALLVSTKANAQQMAAKAQTTTHLSSTIAKINTQVKDIATEGSFLLKGTVKSLEDGLALEGANIKVIGLNQATITNSDGIFKLFVKGLAQQEVTLLITYLGHSSQQVKVKLTQEPEDLTISLASDSIILGKVSVTAPVVEIRHVITGGIIAVKTEELKRPSFFKRMLDHVGGWFK
ncbi:carboxypeptidase-like regulatory domain-containing protein [Pedobacter sp. SL55]|uniref:carboxypeptidase-like regulatory domain-containing protein n=1 Tax=Pedobacter sp. SL55 TaxID=2995161 RepID=UPI0022702083|nr:carboxypeptidase-like regulatory domain-containing protein [Pedobacter sp. SL55]WAC39431.1 carboxypeptidase-like regulatory domain-containing protein [Pedobacter sp. SL55]